MNGQQAPTSRPTFSAMQSSRLLPVHTASMSVNLIAGQTSAAMMIALNSVRIVFATLPNNRCRSQPGMPVVTTGGSSGAINCRLTKAVCASMPPSALVESDARVVPVHQRAGDERGDEIKRHRDADDLNRLSGLVERRAGEHRDQIRVADSHRQR